MDPTPLFQGNLVRLTAPMPEQDAAIEARWTQDLEFLHLVGSGIARPLSPYQIKKRYTDLDKDESGRNYQFSIRLVEDDRLVGFLRLHHIEWNAGTGWIKLGIASPSDRGRGLGSQALGLGLRYAFGELNLRRLNAPIVEYNQPAVELFKKFGFQEDVRRREAYLRGGQRWDGLILGLLKREWSVSLRKNGEKQ